MEFRKVWSYEELGNKMKGRIKLPKKLYVYSFTSYPHWALVTALHYQRSITEEDLDRNLKLIEMIPLDVIYKTDIHDLREQGVVV